MKTTKLSAALTTQRYNVAPTAVVATARPEEKISFLGNTTLGRVADEVCSYSGRVFDGGPNCYPAAPFYVELSSGMRHYFVSENMARRSQYWAGS